MSDFWPTLLAGLLGALVGGAFTAFGAWFQTRGLSKVTSLQMEEMIRQGLEVTRRQVKVEAALELQRALGLLRTAIHKIEQDHSGHKPGSCEAPDLRAELAEQMATLDQSYLLYERMFGDWEAIDKALMELFDFLDGVTMGRAPARVRPSDKKFLESWCLTAVWTNGAADLVSDASVAIRMALASEVGAARRVRRAVAPSERTRTN
ncbi:hypothetical protein [Nonomuraea fuscirosea]|uniref:hypothetical protein n=1 Tax=Nonomuraea fuscirosea TaxID=1291556 RepID=UPI00341607A5